MGVFMMLLQCTAVVGHHADRWYHLKHVSWFCLPFHVMACSASMHTEMHCLFHTVPAATSATGPAGALRHVTGDEIIALNCRYHCCPGRSRPAPSSSYTAVIATAPAPPLQRIAWSADLGGVSPVDPEVAKLCHQATHWLGTALGAQVADNAHPDFTAAPTVCLMAIFVVLCCCTYPVNICSNCSVFQVPASQQHRLTGCI